MVTDSSPELDSQVGLFAVPTTPPERSMAAGQLSPKRPPTETAGLADLFPYYAGFRFRWAREVIRSQTREAPMRVLDPWNGSGTTTMAAKQTGNCAIGVDLNPVANVIAKLRVTAPNSNALDLRPPKANGALKQEPLLSWLDRKSANRVRYWTNSLTDSEENVRWVGLTALFRVCRELTKDFQGSNPTWVRRTSESRPPVTIPAKELDKLILQQIKTIHNRVLTQQDASGGIASIVQGSTRNLPMTADSVDMILTSPPYLTRIDYAVAYARELAVLGIDISTDRWLRERLMGTTQIRSDGNNEPEVQGVTAKQLLKNIAAHTSKASNGYYLKQARQYLNDLVASLGEITRVSKNGCLAVFVVQDSYYKDIPIRLADIYEEEAVGHGWTPVGRKPWEVRRLLTALNKDAQLYPKGKVEETVLILAKD
jgi:DNA modification methylase